MAKISKIIFLVYLLSAVQYGAASVLKGQHHEHETVGPVELKPKMEQFTVPPFKLEPFTISPFTIPSFKIEPFTLPSLTIEPMEPLKFNLSDLETQIKKQISDALSQSFVVKIETFHFNASQIEEQIRRQMEIIANLTQPIKLEPIKFEMDPLVKKQIEDAVEAARNLLPVNSLANLTANSFDKNMELLDSILDRFFGRAVDALKVVNGSTLGLNDFDTNKQLVIDQIGKLSERTHSGIDTTRNLLSKLFGENSGNRTLVL